MLKKIFKKQFISFYYDEKYKLILEHVKNKKTLDSIEKEFDDKQKLEKFVEEKLDDNPQTYISTTLLSLNQGVMDSCSKQKYLEKDIDYDNVKILCVNNIYSFYASIYDINKVLKEYSFNIDFLYSIFAPIDFYAKERKNRFYVLVLNNYIAILGYENYKPIFSDIIIINEEEKVDESNEEIIEDIEDIDLLNEIEEDTPLDENIEEIDEKEIEENLEEKLDKLTTNIEVKILNSLKESLKDYYENYSNDFIEKIIILDTIGIDITLNNLIEDELLIPSEIENFDLLKTLNRMSIESI
ncbi:hypothetical protein FE773_08775 [Caminibacter mediatlanticus TB-2]|uniref:Clan AA aspartic protease n=1 Tax=Caminibacter mediatlanticus TB-2 TaxID=391592 RepID=A0ABX5VAF4_9BACT|nr:hypothetical protein [Caminibacter mediatlanticus]QCT95282.1 hypothetical protein FE773_08775 [Caminibacter mediatlanticus TB-2]